MSDDETRDLYKLLARSLGEPTFSGFSEDNERGVDVERLMPEVADLRAAALRYGRAIDGGTGADVAGLELKITAVRYANKLDKALHGARRPNYAEIFETARREHEGREN